MKQVLKNGLTAIIHKTLNPMNTVKEIFTGANGEMSSKRITAMILVIVAVIVIFLGLFGHVNPLDDSLLTLVSILIGAAIGLLGVSNFEKLKHGNNTTNGDTYKKYNY